MDYTLVTNHDQHFFEENVNRKIKEGWKPLGGVCVSRDRRHGSVGMIYAQAFIKE